MELLASQNVGEEHFWVRTSGSASRAVRPYIGLRLQFVAGFAALKAPRSATRRDVCIAPLASQCAVEVN